MQTEQRMISPAKQRLYLGPSWKGVPAPSTSGSSSARQGARSTPMLLPGSSLWQGNRSSIAEVPASMRDCKFLQTRASDAHSSNPEYISVAAHEEVEAFVLLHCLAPVAGWLRDKFEEEKHTKVHMKWSLGFGYSLAAYANLSYKRHRDAHMKVWRLKKGSLLPGETLVLGGLGHSSLLSPSFNYVLCWKPVLDSTLSSTSRRVKINYKSKQALNEALEEAVVRQDVTKAEMLLKKGADAQITLSTASFRGCLLTKVPAMTHNMPMLCCLVEHGAELDWYSLMYVLQFSHVLPAAHAPVSDFLTRYVRAGRNPANTCYAIALGLANVAKEHTSKASEYSVLSEKFRQTTINLIEDLNKLSYIGGKERWMLRPDEVLEPTKCFSEHFPINLSSCSSTALKLHDTDYSSTSTVQNFLKRAWVGVHFIQVARATGDAPMEETSVCSNMYLLSIMSQYGFIGSLGRRFVQPASFIAHVVLFAGRPFFDSPRGRWCFKCLMHAAFLLVFHVALFEPKGRERLQATGARDMPLASRPGVAAWLPDETNARLSSDGFMHVVFSLMACWVAGMGVDLLNTCAYQYGGSLRRFLTVESLTNKLDITQFVVLSACLVNWGVVELSARGDLDVGQESSLRALKIVFSLSAIVVWVQTMFILRPINRGLAPLLYVIQQMMSEVLVFLVPLCALLLGFAAAILSLFWGSINEELGWTSMWDVILLLFRFFVSDFQMSFDIFDPGRYDNTFEPDPVLRLYAIFILILYTIVASILMANLLIAIITYKYDPEKIDAESNFQRVMMLEDYQTQVENRLLPAPFSLLVAALQLLSAPGGVCPKLPQRAFARLLLPPLDDLCDLPRRPTGARELPHLVYLLVMAPFVNALLLGALALCLPYCVLMFGSRASNHLAKMAARAVARPAGFAPVSRLRTLLTRKHVPRREALAQGPPGGRLRRGVSRLLACRLRGGSGALCRLRRVSWCGRRRCATRRSGSREGCLGRGRPPRTDAWRRRGAAAWPRACPTRPRQRRGPQATPQTRPSGGASCSPSSGRRSSRRSRSSRRRWTPHSRAPGCPSQSPAASPGRSPRGSTLQRSRGAATACGSTRPSRRRRSASAPPSPTAGRGCRTTWAPAPAAGRRSAGSGTPGRSPPSSSGRRRGAREWRSTRTAPRGARERRSTRTAPGRRTTRGRRSWRSGA
uniref:Ion transport domain-containing protein n=1 Tax=Tetraselmis sp. GSL018 TaxID=582737 RepID=A0A061QNY8_9CHLO